MIHFFTPCLRSVLGSMVLLAGCAALPQQEFLSVSYSLRGAQGEMQAVRSIDADGQVRGSHATQSGGAPIVSMGRETATPEHLGELRSLMRRLPETQPPRPEAAPYQEFLVRFEDGSHRVFYCPASDVCSDGALRRIQEIMRSYRAGYW